MPSPRELSSRFAGRLASHSRARGERKDEVRGDAEHVGLPLLLQGLAQLRAVAVDLSPQAPSNLSIAPHITGSSAWVAALVMTALADVLTRLVVICLRGRRFSGQHPVPSRPAPAPDRAPAHRGQLSR
jgi:hypothetical protein